MSSVFIAIAAFCAFAKAQSPNFEIASIKPASQSRLPGFQVLPGGKLLVTNFPFFMIVAEAYNVPYQSMRLSGGPDWVRAERYDIEAVPPPGAIPPRLSSRAVNDRVMLMLQRLLTERCKLTVRHDLKEMPAYAVTVSKSGLRLAKSQTDEKDCIPDPSMPGVACHSFNGGMGRGLHGKAVGISDIAAFVENWSDRPVVDKTGIKGLYEIKTDGWVPMRQMPPRPENPNPTAENLGDPDRPTLFTVFEQIGLKLEAQRLPIDIYVIENVERPSPN